MELFFFYCALLKSWKTHVNGRARASECCRVQLIEFTRLNICVLLSSAIGGETKLRFLIASSIRRSKSNLERYICISTLTEDETYVVVYIERDFLCRRRDVLIRSFSNFVKVNYDTE